MQAEECNCKINKNDIIDLLRDKEHEILKGEKQSFVFNVDKYEYPLKIVLFSAINQITIISVYPFKGKLK
jgi:hypothetical protein